MGGLVYHLLLLETHIVPRLGHKEWQYKCWIGIVLVTNISSSTKGTHFIGRNRDQEFNEYIRLLSVLVLYSGLVRANITLLMMMP